MAQSIKAEEGEAISVKKVSPYGFQLLDGSFTGATKQVRDFVGPKLPAVLMVEEVDDYGKISRVKFVEKINIPEPKAPTSNGIGLSVSDEAKQKATMISTLTSYAKDYAILLVEKNQMNTEMAKSTAKKTIWEFYEFFRDKLDGKEVKET